MGFQGSTSFLFAHPSEAAALAAALFSFSPEEG